MSVRRLLVAALLLAAPGMLGAQDRAVEARLAGRLDESARREVLAIVDSARRESLPVDPLVARALEGASKGASEERIVAAVRRLRDALADARRALGPEARPEEIAAGASAIQARVPVGVLATLRRERSDAPMTVPISVLADLIARGVPVDTATSAVLALARADDATLVAFRRDVERDIAVGAMPAAAASIRAASFANEATRAITLTGPSTSDLNSGNASPLRPAVPRPRKP